MALTDGVAAALGVEDPRTWGREEWLADVLPHLAYGAAVQTVLENVPTQAERTTAEAEAAEARSGAAEARSALEQAQAASAALQGRVERDAAVRERATKAVRIALALLDEEA